MARAKAVLGSGARLSDFMSASLLARVFPSESVCACLDKNGRNSQRVRSFPADSGVYYCMALSLNSHGGQVFHYNILNPPNSLHNPTNTRVTQSKVRSQLRHGVVSGSKGSPDCCVAVVGVLCFKVL